MGPTFARTAASVFLFAGAESLFAKKFPEIALRIVEKSLCQVEMFCLLVFYPGESFQPFDLLGYGTVSLPETNALVVDARYTAYSFLLGPELRMTQKSSHVKCGIIGTNIQPRQTITGMAQFPAEEIFVLREECHGADPV